MNPTVRKYEKHGMTNSKAYRVWYGMFRRCLDPDFKHYNRYGGRGITVSEEWQQSFSKFYKDMGDPPKGATLERKDNDKGYCKENCRWATRLEQSVNRNNNVPMTVNGVTKSLAEWVKERGLDYNLVYYRKHIGKWDDEQCLQPKKLKQPVFLKYKGKDYSVKEIADKTGISITSVHLRIRNGWTVEEIINRPNSQPYKKPGWKFTPA